MTQRWTKRPPGSNWGDFGPDDQIGRLNLMDRAKVKQGLAEAVEGITFCLSLPLDYPGGSGLNPRRKPPVVRPTLREGAVNFNATLPGASDVLCDDLAIIHLQYSTQWDALCHVGGQFDTTGNGTADKVFYNGYRAGEHIIAPDEMSDAGVGSDMKPHSTSQATALGIENAAAHGIQGRGVMVDLRAHFGDDRTLVDHDMLMQVMEADGVQIEQGDMLVLHTGFAQVILDMHKTPDEDRLHNACAVLDGRDARLLQWITDSGIAAIAADNYAVEAHPATPGEGCCSTLPLHEHCLFKNGIMLGELWHLTPLAEWLRANGRSRFLITAPPLRLPSAVGSPVTPVATV
jgi:kynurenine formamidase